MSVVKASEVVELIGKDDAAIAASKYSKSAAISLVQYGTMNGEIVGVALYSSETGSGAVQAPACKLLFFDQDPAISAADAALAAAGAEHKTIIGTVSVAAADWISDANGAVAYKALNVPIPAKKQVWAALLLDAGVTTINSAAGDDEIIELRVFYRSERWEK